MSEIWKTIPGHEAYEVSSLGRVRKGEKLCAIARQNCGYNVAWVDGKVRLVHKLVAKAFLGDADGKQVDHIDGDKTNNSVDNLRYVTASENARHSFDFKRGTNRTGQKGTPVVMVTDGFVCTFVSMAAAARAVRKNPSSIWHAADGRYLCAGARWYRAEGF